MRSIEFSDGRDVAIRAAGKDNHAIGRIHRNRMNVSRLRVNVETVVVLVQRVRALDDALRLSRLNAGGCVVETIEYLDAEQIRVLNDHLVAQRIDCDRAVNGICILDCPHRRAGHFGGVPGFWGRCVDRCLLKSRKQVLVFQCRNHARIATRRLRRTDLSIIGQFLNRNQSG